MPVCYKRMSSSPVCLESLLDCIVVSLYCKFSFKKKTLKGVVNKVFIVKNTRNNFIYSISFVIKKGVAKHMQHS